MATHQLNRLRNIIEYHYPLKTKKHKLFLSRNQVPVDSLSSQVYHGTLRLSLWQLSVLSWIFLAVRFSLFLLCIKYFSVVNSKHSERWLNWSSAGYFYELQYIFLFMFSLHMRSHYKIKRFIVIVLNDNKW